jgi:hypothetical protein
MSESYSTHGKPEGKRPLGRPRRIWKANIRMDRREREWDGVDYIHLVQDRDQWRTLVDTVMKFRAPYTTDNFFKLSDYQLIKDSAPWSKVVPLLKYHPIKSYGRQRDKAPLIPNIDLT